MSVQPSMYKNQVVGDLYREMIFSEYTGEKRRARTGRDFPGTVMGGGGGGGGGDKNLAGTILKADRAN